MASIERRTPIGEERIMSCASRVLLIGGGIAGLSTAIALARRGIHCDVVELSDEALGASMGISGRAAEALDELGIYDQMYEQATPWARDSKVASFFDATGRLISELPERPEWPGYKTALGVYRPVLLAVMAENAQKLGVEIRRGITAETINDTGDVVDVTFTDGQKGQYDFVVGADGIGSATRARIFPDVPKPTYAGQISVRWSALGPAIQPEGWYLGPVGKLGFFHLPQGMVCVAAVVDEAEYHRKTDEEAYSLVTRLLDSYTAPAIVEIRDKLTPKDKIIIRPFEWVFLPEAWYRGRVLLIGDAAHATTAHMGMGGGMALEDSVVLAQCVASNSSVPEAFQAFMDRRLSRARTVVETSIALSNLEQSGAPRSENHKVYTSGLNAIAQPY